VGNTNQRYLRWEGSGGMIEGAALSLGAVTCNLTIQTTDTTWVDQLNKRTLNSFVRGPGLWKNCFTFSLNWFGIIFSINFLVCRI
jgi:hypothetical protein